MFLRVEHIDLPVEAATRIARTAVTSADPSAAWAETEVECKAGRAVRTASTGFAFESGAMTHAKAAGVVDWVYATDVNPPCTPSFVAGALLGSKIPVTTTSPTNFEIRPVGARLEACCDWDESRQGLDVELKTYLTDSMGLVASGQGASTTYFPKFHERSAQGIVALPSASWRLFGMVNPPPGPPPERRTLVWVRRDEVAVSGPGLSDDHSVRGMMFLFEVYELPADTATSLLEAWRASPAAANLRDRVAGAVEQGHGRILTTASGSLAANSPTRVRSLGASIVPTEMDPPELPNRVSGVFIHPEKIPTEINVTAFDIRPDGFTANISATNDSPAGSLRCTMEAEWTERDLDVALGDIPGRVRHPYFRKATLSTSCLVPFDQPTLVLLASPPARTRPLPEVRRTENWKEAPIYQTSATPRVLMFLTVSPTG